MSVGSAPGKAILFGEHAVVFGRPAIAVPVHDRQATAWVRSGRCGSGIVLHAEDLDRHYALMDAPTDDALALIVRLTLMTLQRELTSSPQAVAATLRKMVDDRNHSESTRKELRGFLRLAESIDVGRKSVAVREILERYEGQFLIFTEYRRTLESLIRHLRSWDIEAVAFHGGMSIIQKEAAVAAFRASSCFPCESAALPAWVPGVSWSDQVSFWQAGYRGVMVTDTAFHRYPHYHRPTDTPDRLDYTRLAEVAEGLAGAVARLATQPLA